MFVEQMDTRSMPSFLPRSLALPFLLFVKDFCTQLCAEMAMSTNIRELHSAKIL